MISKILAIALLAISCTSPEQTETPRGGTVQVSPSELTLDFEEQEIYVTVTADADWGSTVADPSWCSVYPTGGMKGETKVKITVKKNILTEDRQNTITFRTTSSKTELPVTQQTSSTGEAMFVPEDISSSGATSSTVRISTQTTGPARQAATAGAMLSSSIIPTVLKTWMSVTASW